MSKLMSTRTFSGTFPSPETPPSGEDGSGIGLPKGWSSERVPRSSYRSRRQVASAALMPFSSGRTLPSKWEDAERWICSPVSLGNASTHSNNYYCYYGTVGSAGPKVPTYLAHQQRRAKSKSGPLGPVGPSYYTSGYNNFSPVLGVGVINEEKWRNTLVSESPGLASARFDERLSTDSGGGGGGESEGGRRSCPGHDTANWLDSSWSRPPSPTQDEMNFSDENNEAANNEEEEKWKNAGVERSVSKRDMATQMYSESENESMSPSQKSSISATSPHPQLLNEPEFNPKTKTKPEPKKEVESSSEYEVRNVQVDKQQAASSTKPRPHDHNNVREDDDSSIISTTRIGTDNQISNDSKSHREEAKINAWENLQKAKAESAIQKLEEKLEKKRESSMGKIIQKLGKAESKARRMRNSISNGGHNTEGGSIWKPVSKNPNSFYKRIRLFSLSRNCATCYPF